MIKLAALGALGYAGYKYYLRNLNENGKGNTITQENAVAGGPLSDNASVQPTAGSPART